MNKFQKSIYAVMLGVMFNVGIANANYATGLHVTRLIQREDWVFVAFNGEYKQSGMCTSSDANGQPNDIYWGCRFCIPPTDDAQKQKLAVLIAAFTSGKEVCVEFMENQCENYGNIYYFSRIVTIIMQ